MNPVKRRLVIAGIISLSIVAAACGSDSNSGSTAAPTTAAGAASTTEAAAAGTTEAATSPTEAAATTAATATVDFAKLAGSIIGSGATFPKGFYDDAIATLAGLAPDLTRGVRRRWFR